MEKISTIKNILQNEFEKYEYGKNNSVLFSPEYWLELSLDDFIRQIHDMNELEKNNVFNVILPIFLNIFSDWMLEKDQSSFLFIYLLTLGQVMTLTVHKSNTKNVSMVIFTIVSGLHKFIITKENTKLTTIIQNIIKIGEMPILNHYLLSLGKSTLNFIEICSMIDFLMLNPNDLMDLLSRFPMMISLCKEKKNEFVECFLKTFINVYYHQPKIYNALFSLAENNAIILTIEQYFKNNDLIISFTYVVFFPCITSNEKKVNTVMKYVNKFSSFHHKNNELYFFSIVELLHYYLHSKCQSKDLGSFFTHNLFFIDNFLFEQCNSVSIFIQQNLEHYSFLLSSNMMRFTNNTSLMLSKITNNESSLNCNLIFLKSLKHTLNTANANFLLSKKLVKSFYCIFDLLVLTINDFPKNDDSNRLLQQLFSVFNSISPNISFSIAADENDPKRMLSSSFEPFIVNEDLINHFLENYIRILNILNDILPNTKIQFFLFSRSFFASVHHFLIPLVPLTFSKQVDFFKKLFAAIINLSMKLKTDDIILKKYLPLIIHEICKLAFSIFQIHDSTNALLRDIVVTSAMELNLILNLTFISQSNSLMFMRNVEKWPKLNTEESQIIQYQINNKVFLVWKNIVDKYLFDNKIIACKPDSIEPVSPESIQEITRCVSKSLDEIENNNEFLDRIINILKVNNPSVMLFLSSMVNMSLNSFDKLIRLLYGILINEVEKEMFSNTYFWINCLHFIGQITANIELKNSFFDAIEKMTMIFVNRFRFSEEIQADYEYVSSLLILLESFYNGDSFKLPNNVFERLSIISVILAFIVSVKPHKNVVTNCINSLICIFNGFEIDKLSSSYYHQDRNCFAQQQIKTLVKQCIGIYRLYKTPNIGICLSNLLRSNWSNGLLTFVIIAQNSRIDERTLLCNAIHKNIDLLKMYNREQVLEKIYSNNFQLVIDPPNSSFAFYSSAISCIGLSFLYEEDLFNVMCQNFRGFFPKSSNFFVTWFKYSSSKEDSTHIYSSISNHDFNLLNLKISASCLYYLIRFVKFQTEISPYDAFKNFYLIPLIEFPDFYHIETISHKLNVKILERIYIDSICSFNDIIHNIIPPICPLNIFFTSSKKKRLQDFLYNTQAFFNDDNGKEIPNLSRKLFKELQKSHFFRSSDQKKVNWMLTFSSFIFDNFPPKQLAIFIDNNLEIPTEEINLWVDMSETTIKWATSIQQIFCYLKTESKRKIKIVYILYPSCTMQKLVENCFEPSMLPKLRFLNAEDISNNFKNISLRFRPIRSPSSIITSSTKNSISFFNTWLEIISSAEYNGKKHNLYTKVLIDDIVNIKETNDGITIMGKHNNLIHINTNRKKSIVLAISQLRKLNNANIDTYKSQHFVSSVSYDSIIGSLAILGEYSTHHTRRKSISTIPLWELIKEMFHVDDESLHDISQSSLLPSVGLTMTFFEKPNYFVITEALNSPKSTKISRIKTLWQIIRRLINNCDDFKQQKIEFWNQSFNEKSLVDIIFSIFNCNIPNDKIDEIFKMLSLTNYNLFTMILLNFWESQLIDISVTNSSTYLEYTILDHIVNNQLNFTLHYPKAVFLAIIGSTFGTNYHKSLSILDFLFRIREVPTEDLDRITPETKNWEKFNMLIKIAHKIQRVNDEEPISNFFLKLDKSKNRDVYILNPQISNDDVLNSMKNSLRNNDLLNFSLIKLYNNVENNAMLASKIFWLSIPFLVTSSTKLNSVKLFAAIVQHCAILEFPNNCNLRKAIMQFEKTLTLDFYKNFAKSISMLISPILLNEESKRFALSILKKYYVKFYSHLENLAYLLLPIYAFGQQTDLDELNINFSTLQYYTTMNFNPSKAEMQIWCALFIFWALSVDYKPQRSNDLLDALDWMMSTLNGFTALIKVKLFEFVKVQSLNSFTSRDRIDKLRNKININHDFQSGSCELSSPIVESKNITDLNDITLQFIIGTQEYLNSP